MSARICAVVRSIGRSPLSGRNASRNTREEMRSKICSAAPETGQPPYEWPTRQMSRRSSYLTTLTMSAMWVSRLIAPLIRCERSPSPVSVGVNTVWPCARKRSATRRQHQPPCQAPCTSTKVLSPLLPMPVMVVVMMAMAVIVLMVMRMIVLVLVMVQPLARARPARVLVEHQRLDGHRHGVRREADAAEIDEVEVPQHHAVDGEYLALHVELVAQDVAERLRDVAVQHDVERLAPRDALGKAAADTLGETGEALVGGRALPAEGERDLALLLDVEGDDVAADRLRDLLRIDGLLADVRRLQDLQIAARQQRAGRRDVARVAAELHAVFGRAERGGADAFVRGQQRPGKRPGVDAGADGTAEAAAEVAEIPALAAVDVFADAAREHDAVDAAEIEDRIG